jgi:hypothetical protein
MTRTLKGITYVSVWVLLWGTAASIADFVLLEREAYGAGSGGQAITFASYGIAAVVLAVRLSGRFLSPGPEPAAEQRAEPANVQPGEQGETR